MNKQIIALSCTHCKCTNIYVVSQYDELFQCATCYSFNEIEKSNPQPTGQSNISDNIPHCFEINDFMSQVATQEDRDRFSKQIREDLSRNDYNQNKEKWKQREPYIVAGILLFWIILLLAIN